MPVKGMTSPVWAECPRSPAARLSALSVPADLVVEGRRLRVHKLDRPPPFFPYNIALKRAQLPQLATPFCSSIIVYHRPLTVASSLSLFIRFLIMPYPQDYDNKSTASTQSGAPTSRNGGAPSSTSRSNTRTGVVQATEALRREDMRKWHVEMSRYLPAHDSNSSTSNGTDR